MSEPSNATTPVTDARVLRALAHPLRVRMLNALALLPSATATQIAEAVGDTPANCSWHMRQLSKYGYVEEAPGGTGRQRPWRVVIAPRSWGSSDEDEELAMAGNAAAEVLLDYEVQMLKQWQQQRMHESAQWRDAPNLSQSIQWLTVEEAKALNDDLTAVIGRHIERLTDPSLRPPGSRPMRVIAWSVPAAPLHIAQTVDAAQTELDVAQTQLDEPAPQGDEDA